MSIIKINLWESRVLFIRKTKRKSISTIFNFTKIFKTISPMFYQVTGFLNNCFWYIHNAAKIQKNNMQTTERRKNE